MGRRSGWMDGWRYGVRTVPYKEMDGGLVRLGLFALWLYASRVNYNYILETAFSFKF